MAHGQRARYWGNLRDWWGKRPYSGISVSRHGMKLFKRLVHKVERQEAKKYIKKEL